MPIPKPVQGEEFLGVGPKVPITQSDVGEFKMLAGRELVVASVFSILQTKATFRSSDFFACGERFMRDDFGQRAYTARHDNLDDQMIALVESHWIEAIERWEPRVEITSVRTEVNGENMVTDIEMLLKATNESANLVIIRDSQGKVKLKQLSV